MSAGKPEPMILAIGVRNEFLHIYRDEKDLLRDDDIGAGEGESRFPLEFFDSDGHRLAGVYDGQWRLLRLMPTAEPPSPRTVQRRVRNALEHIREYIEENPRTVELYGLTMEEALELMPEVRDKADLADSLLAFTGDTERSHVELTLLEANDTQGFGHAMAHLAGRAHKKRR